MTTADVEYEFRIYGTVDVDALVQEYHKEYVDWLVGDVDDPSLRIDFVKEFAAEEGRYFFDQDAVTVDYEDEEIYVREQRKADVA